LNTIQTEELNRSQVNCQKEFWQTKILESLYFSGISPDLPKA